MITVAIISLLLMFYFTYKYNKDTSEYDREPVTSILKEKKTITEDDIRFHAYLLAEKDGFSQSPEFYWKSAEIELKETQYGNV